MENPLCSIKRMSPAQSTSLYSTAPPAVIRRRFISVDDSLINGNHFSVTKDKRVCGSCSACVAAIISGATDNLPGGKRKCVLRGLSHS